MCFLRFLFLHIRRRAGKRKNPVDESSSEITCGIGQPLQAFIRPAEHFFGRRSCVKRFPRILKHAEDSGCVNSVKRHPEVVERAAYPIDFMRFKRIIINRLFCFKRVFPVSYDECRISASAPEDSAVRTVNSVIVFLPSCGSVVSSDSFQ